jgi:hypothetical protein
MAAATTNIRVTFTRAPGGKCAIAMGFPALTGSTMFPFGDPVPVFATGAIAGFECHDVFHFTLLAECGISPVLDILALGANGGVFGGPGALAEEAVVLDVHLSVTNDARKSALLLSGATGRSVNPKALARAITRGEAAHDHVLAGFKAKGVGSCLIAGIPVTWARKAIARARASSGRAAARPLGPGPGGWIRIHS